MTQFNELLLVSRNNFILTAMKTQIEKEMNDTQRWPPFTIKDRTNYLNQRWQYIQHFKRHEHMQIN